MSRGRSRSVVSRLLDKIADLATRRARLVVVVWALLVVALAGLGSNIERKVFIHPAYIDGTPSKRAHEIAVQEFGGGDTMIVMLRGPRADVEQQGQQLARRLGTVPRMRVVSPWARGAEIEGLRPAPGVAALLVHVAAAPGGGEDAVDVLPPVQRQVDENVTSPVHASIAGFPVVVNSVRTAGEHASVLGELIAVPILLLVLLFVFRSVLAALLPVVVGGAVVVATRGILDLMLGFVEIDLFAVSVVVMMGLALGVDYSLLAISRFREEREKADLTEAMQVTVSATARSIVPAGSALVLAMVASTLLIPGTIIRSVSLAVIVTALLSVLWAICVVPAMLTLLGDNLDRWSLPRRETSQVAPLRWSRRINRHPRAVVGIMCVLLLLAGLAFNLDSGTSSIALLPSADPGRLQQEEIQRYLGPGWVSPMEVVMDTGGTPVTSPSRLRALAAFQRKVERDPGVESMAGFSKVSKAVKPLEGINRTLADQERGLDRLETGIGKIYDGTKGGVSSLLEAEAGSKQLESGLGAAHDGAGVLAGALQLTSTGSGKLSEGLGRVDEGSGKLAQGTTQASTGAGKLADGLEKAQEQSGELQGSARLFKNAMLSGEDRLSEVRARLQSTEAQLAEARQALQRMTAGRSDPEFAATLRAVEVASRELTGTDPGTGEPLPSGGAGRGVDRAEGQFGVGLYLASRLDATGRQASRGIGKLARGAVQLDDGLGRLAAGGRRLSDGVSRLAQGGQQLSPALQRLSDGADRLVNGLGQLHAGAGQFSHGLEEGGAKSTLLVRALQRISDGLAHQRSPDGGGSQFDRLQRQSPGLFKSSYFILAGFDGTSPEKRRQIAFLINLEHGGQDARMVVIPSDEQTSDAARETKDRLEADAEGLASKTGTEVVVGGVAPTAIALNDEFRGQAPLMRLAFSLVSLLVLIPVLRSLVIPVLAALINLITVSASLGILSLLFNGSLLGGPGYVDVVVIPASMMVMFGLAIDYEVFVFARIREEYVRTGSSRKAVANGLDRTAHVVTGAAVIMIIIFLAFSASDYISLRDYGVVQAIAIAIDAFVVRLVVIPAMIVWLGKWSWWMPSWLDRLLPGGSAVIGPPKREPA
ncbi:MAG TPA: MMPL family transporter [Solirubrobacterales bacterium]|jgi:RND superfamily putative drug exporter|nr:MMPL family transporter [Solirubrobacterales bacterium]